VKPLCALFLLAGIPAAMAAEQNIALKNAPGRDAVEATCAACHSLDYIPLNSPFLNREGWTAEVNKMINAYGAPIPASDAAKIIDYLAANYGQ
jgi:mono/diheme cytochrome c family protein